MEWKIDSHHISCPYKVPTTIYIPIEIYELCKRLDEVLRSEWVIYADILWVLHNKGILVSPYIPKQVASSAHVEVKESVDLPVAIHSHTPVATRDFSATDMEYIVANSEVALLWMRDEFTKCYHRKKMPCGERLLVECRTFPVIVLHSSIPEINIDHLVSEALQKVERQKTVVEYGYETIRKLYSRDEGSDEEYLYEDTG